MTQATKTCQLPSALSHDPGALGAADSRRGGGDGTDDGGGEAIEILANASNSGKGHC